MYDGDYVDSEGDDYVFSEGDEDDDEHDNWSSISVCDSQKLTLYIIMISWHHIII